MESPGPLMYISIVVLILLSAFFSASETAISTFNRIRMRKQAQDGDKKAVRTMRVAEQYNKTLSTILVGNNLVNIVASTIATMIATSLFGSYGAVVSTVVMTILVLTFGEIIPKSYGMRKSDALAKSVSGVLSGLNKVLTPITFFFTRLDRRVNTNADDAAPSVTEEELLFFLDHIEGEGVIEKQERELVQSALEFDEITIKEIITPRVDLVALDADDDQETIRSTVIEEGYSRIPVYEGTIDNIIGILLARDILRKLVCGEEIVLRDMMTEPYFVHRSMKLSGLLEGLKARKVNMAVVLDEYGGTVGVVTMEDVLEELVGEIWDEDDEVPGDLVRLSENRFEVLGSCDLEDFMEAFGLDAEEDDDDVNTVGGWAMQLFEHIPEAGEVYEDENLRLKVLDMDGRRILKMIIERLDHPKAAEDGE